MNEKDMLQLKASLNMPPKMADTLTKSCNTTAKRHIRCRRHRSLYAAAAALFCIFAAGSTSLAYNVYQEKQLAVFMDPELSQMQIDYIGQKIAGISAISSYEYISGDKAWEEFKAAYLTDENGSEIGVFEENPLADSFNYRVSVRMNADTRAVREQIGGLPGVRKVTTVREVKAERSASP